MGLPLTPTCQAAAVWLARDVCVPVDSSKPLNISFSKDKVDSELFWTYAGANKSQMLPKVCRMLQILWSEREI